ncbi:MAG: hypothetical protein AAF628_33375 [Planctomycetota bacterium]
MPRHPTACCVALFAIAAALPGQRPARVLAETANGLADAAGVHVLDGAVVGAGPGYRASFERSAITVALTGAGNADHRLRFELTGAGREVGPALALRDAEPRCEDEQVIYERGPLLERYEARAKGVKQSFVFEEIPPGHGDLLVTGRIVAPPRLHRADSDHLELGFYARPLLRVSDIVGIDATGARVRGTLGLRGDVLEMRLPPTFVDEVVAPLVLDPFIGPAAGLATNFEGTEFDAAYDEANDVYLVVWHRIVGGTAHTGYAIDALGQRVRGNGTFVGGLIRLSSQPGVLGRASVSVASVNGADAFVVGGESAVLPRRRRPVQRDPRHHRRVALTGGPTAPGPAWIRIPGCHCNATGRAGVPCPKPPFPRSCWKSKP